MNNQKKKHVNIGLDIGTTSVGWAIIDNDYNVIDYGVRLFEDPCESNKKTRRFRSLRRRYRRIKYRKKKFINLIIKNENLFHFDKAKIKEIVRKTNCLPWNVKVKGLHGEITKEELVYICYHYLKHRGKIYGDEEFDDETKNENRLFSNMHSFKYPSEEQKDVFVRNGFLPQGFNAKFTIQDWKKEIEKIFENQKWLQNSNNFIDKYFELFDSYRDFAIGPGSYYSPTKWGLFALQYDEKLKKMSIIDRRKEKGKWCKDLPSLNRGICNWYNGDNCDEKEYRVNSKTASAIIFSLLDSLQNIRKKGDDSWTISKQEKIDFLRKLFNNDEEKINKNAKRKKCNNSQLDLLLQILDFEKKEVYWNNIDISNILISFELLSIKPLIFIKSIINNDFTLINLINKLIELKISTRNKKKFLDTKKINDVGELVDDDEKKDLLKKIGINQDDKNSKNIDIIYDKFKKLKIGDYSKYSEKALNYFIPKLLNDEKGSNSANFLKNFEQRKNQKNTLVIENNELCISLHNVENDDNFPKSKTVGRQIKQTIRIINAILERSSKHGWIINTISFELCREVNNSANKNKISMIQKWYENKNKKFSKLYNTNNQSILKKLRIASLHDWKDPYDGKSIEPKPDEDINKWADNHVFDHIVPKSYFIFPDNSSSNFVVTKKEHNDKKSENTPYLYLKHDSEFWKKTCTNFKPKIPKILNKKTVLFPDIDKIRKFCFICEEPWKNNELLDMCKSERLLIDTAYATKYLRSIVSNFFQKNLRYKNAKVLSIPGRITGLVRNKFYELKSKKKLEKEFGDNIPLLSNDFYLWVQNAFNKKRFWHKHHAIDAIIIAMISTSNKLRAIIDDHKKNFDRNQTINKIFGFANIQKIAKYVETNDAKYSRMLMKKFNISFFHEQPKPKIKQNLEHNTIFEKIKVNIFKISGDYKKYFFEPKINKNKKEFWNLLTTKLNKAVLDQLKQIFEIYGNDDKKSPFLNFMLKKRDEFIDNNDLNNEIAKILNLNIDKINDEQDFTNFIFFDLKKELCSKPQLKNLISEIYDSEEYRNIVIEIVKKLVKNGYFKDKEIKKIKLKTNDPIYFYLNDINKTKIRNIHFAKAVDMSEEEYKKRVFWHYKTKGYYDRINCIGMDVYYKKSNKNPIAIIPLNVFTVKFNGEKKKISYKKRYFDDLKAQINSKSDYDYKITIYNGQRLCKNSEKKYFCKNSEKKYYSEEEYYYFVGYQNAKRCIEVKPLWYSPAQLLKQKKTIEMELKNDMGNQKKREQLKEYEQFIKKWKVKKRTRLAVNSFFKQYKICHSNILGKIYTKHFK